MDDVLNIVGSDETPHILFDATKGQLEISGRSLPEDAAGFYAPAMDWINRYKQKPQPKTVIQFKLEYFNTASAKQIFRVLSQIVVLVNSGDVEVRWHYQEEDTDMLSSGQRFSKLLGLPMNMIAY